MGIAQQALLMDAPEVVDPGGIVWIERRVRLGCGGWTTGGAVSDDGSTLCAKADVHGAYVFNDLTDEWENMVEYGKVPNSIVRPHSTYYYSGSYEVCPAPNTPNTIYFAISCNEDGAGFAVRVLKSTNKGATSTLCTNFAPGSQGDANGIWRQYGPKMAVDPVNANVVIVGLQQYGAAGDGGTYLTTDGGTSWTQQTAAGLPKPAANTAMTGFLFDRGSVSGGRCQTIYAFSGGNGLYRTTNGGTSWSLFANIATVPHVCDIQQSKVDNTIYFAGDPDLVQVGGSSAVMGFRIVGGTLSALPVPSWPVTFCLMPHPTLAGCVVAQGGDGGLNISYDSGTTWAGWYVMNDQVVTSPDIPWLATTPGAKFLCTSRGVIDPSVGKPRSGKVVSFGGYGVYHTVASVPSSGTFNCSSVSMTKGIELLCATGIDHPPGGKFLMTVQDKRCFFRGDDELQTYPSMHGFAKGSIGTGASIDYGTACTWAKSDPSFLTGCAGLFSNDEGYSTDGGATWHEFATYPIRENIPGGASFINGCMAAATPNSIIWWPTNRKAPWYTKNGGASWALLNFGGNTGTGDWCFDSYWANYLFRHIVDADNVNIGTYLAYIQGVSNPTAAAACGLWLSTDYGDNWTKIRAGTMFPFEFHQKLKHVRGIGGAYIYTAGDQSGGHSSAGLYKIIVAGGGTGTGAPTVTNYPGVQEPLDFSFGPVMPGKTWPRLWWVGWLNPADSSSDAASPEAFGVYYTDDADLANPTWTKVSTMIPANVVCGITCLGASPDYANLVLIGHNATGFVSISDGFE